MCEVTPAGALRGVDMYRKDGLHTSIQFKLWPITLQEQAIKTPDLNLPRHQVSTHQIFIFAVEKCFSVLCHFMEFPL